MTHPLTQREKVELKPCPMCGMTESTDNATQDSGLQVQPFKSPAGGEACRVQCACGVSGPSAREDWQAASAWNRRTALASGSGDRSGGVTDMIDHAELAGLAEAAIPYLYDGWTYTPPSESLTSGRITGSGNGPVLAVVQWPVPTMDHALCGYDASQPVGAFIAAVNPATVLALLAEIAALRANEKAALKECSEWARKAGEAIGRLETSEAAGIVEGWQERAAEAERKLAEAVGLLRTFVDTHDFRYGEGLIHEIPSSVRKAKGFLSKEAERG